LTNFIINRVANLHRIQKEIKAAVYISIFPDHILNSLEDIILNINIVFAFNG